MLSLRSLAFILCSAIRRARALSSAALHCFPDIINAEKMATNMAAPMCSLLREVYTSRRSIPALRTVRVNRCGQFTKTGVAVEKLIREKSAEISSR
jgi:hypothetical protein